MCSQWLNCIMCKYCATVIGNLMGTDVAKIKGRGRKNLAYEAAAGKHLTREYIV